MQKDIRDTTVFREAESLYRSLYGPGTGQISDAATIDVAPDGQHAVFAGTLVEELEGLPPTQICQIHLTSGRVRVLTHGAGANRMPKFSPDGASVAFLSDRHSAGDFQLYLLDPMSGAERAAPSVDGWIEYLQWSPDGKRILLGVAGHGADISGGQGAVASEQVSDSRMPSWVPSVEPSDEGHRWRHAWIYELDADRLRQVTHEQTNIWEVVWCGNEALAAVVSLGSDEGLWYTASLHLVDLRTGASRLMYAPDDQVGLPAASPSGKHLAIVEAICSDRLIVAGDLHIIDTASAKSRRVDTRGVDVTYAEWRSEKRLLLAGHRGFETVVGLFDAPSGVYTEVWATPEISTGGRYVSVSGCNESGDCALVGESFTRSPEIAVIRAGEYSAVKSFDLGYANQVNGINVEPVTWKAQDGIEIQGWLLRPPGDGPHPLVTSVHGGPVWSWHPTWLGRTRYVPFLMLVNRGYAVFLPNPRGSSGRGQDFAREVVGDMGGADAYDCLSGLDHLVQKGIADPRRLGVTGISYGGFMASWLITQDSRFAAAVPVAPINNYVTEHLLSNIPHFVKKFLDDTFTNPSGKYFQRSPVMHSHKARTPTLSICGALDRCTPPQEAMQFHSALSENGTKSVLVTYPEEGHGIHKLPAAIDFAARVVAWFDEHLGAAN